MTGATRPDIPAVLSAVAIRAYVNATGWTEGPQGSCGSVFERDGFKVSVPHEDDDPDAIRMSLYRLASAEGRTPEATAAAIAEYRDARGPEVTAGVPAVTSPAPAPAGRSGTATGPSSPGAGDLPAPARRAAEAAYRNWRIGDDGEGRLHAALVAAASLIRADERERLGVIPLSETLTDDQVAEFRERFEAAMANPGLPRVLPSDGWLERAEAAEAKLAAIGHLCREPSHVLLKGADAGIEGTDYVRADAILSIIGTERES